MITRVPSETSTPEATLTISGSYCVDRGQELLDALLVHAQGDGTAWVDALDVSRIDTAGLQLLTAAVGELERHGRAWRWLGVSAAIYEAAHAAGLQAALKLPARIT